MKPDFKIPRSVGRHLNFTAAAGNAVCNRLLEPHGLTLAQWAVLSALWRNGALSVKHLAELTGNAPPATSRIVDRMVANGLLRRSQDSRDRRAVTVEPSEKGEGLRGLQAIYEQVNGILLADLSSDEREVFFELLSRVEKTGRDWLGKSRKAENAVTPPK